MNFELSNNLTKLAKIFEKKADLYIVGGFVRDKLLSLKTQDIDLCSSLTITQIQSLLNNTKYILKEANKKLGTVKICCEHEVWDYSTFRKETYLNNGSHNPVEVEFIKSVQEDAKRRDFTVNAIYYNINKQEIIDFYNGLNDIKKRRLRCIETPQFVFKNDGERILRMVRQASQLNFSITADTLHVAKKMSNNLCDISNKRKFDELMKILDLKNRYIIFARSHVKGLRLFNKLGLWKYYFEDVNHVKYSMVKKADNQNRFIGLLIDLVNTKKPDCVSYFLENHLGEKGLGLSKNKIAKDIEVVCGYFDAKNLVNNKDYFFTYFNSFDQISKLLEKSSILVFNKYNFFYKYIVKYKIPVQIKDLKINGNDIKQNYPKIPEKRYKYILTDLLNKVFRAEIDNNKQCLIDEVKTYDI